MLGKENLLMWVWFEIKFSWLTNPTNRICIWLYFSLGKEGYCHEISYVNPNMLIKPCMYISTNGTRQLARSLTCACLEIEIDHIPMQNMLRGSHRSQQLWLVHSQQLIILLQSVLDLWLQVLTESMVNSRKLTVPKDGVKDIVYLASYQLFYTFLAFQKHIMM